MILVIAYLVFVLVGVAILIYTKDVDEETVARIIEGFYE